MAGRIIRWGRTEIPNPFITALTNAVVLIASHRLVFVLPACPKRESKTELFRKIHSIKNSGGSFCIHQSFCIYIFQSAIIRPKRFVIRLRCCPASRWCHRILRYSYSLTWPVFQMPACCGFHCGSRSGSADLYQAVRELPLSRWFHWGCWWHRECVFRWIPQVCGHLK